jgi:hypothetical protein
MLDAIVDRREVRDFIIQLLNFMMNPEITGETESSSTLVGSASRK